MILAKFLNNLFKKGGFELIDANSKKHVIGNPKEKKPLIIKLFDKSLHYKLLFYPDFYFGEAYTEGTLTIENGTLTEFLNMALQNIGRKETNFFSEILNNIGGSYRYLTNFNFIKKSKINAARSYDISDDLYDLFLDSKRQYSCAYFKNENDSLETAQNNKIEHIIKKLNIKPNQKVLDIGSGWGSLAIEIAKKTQCQVLGITLSKNQFAYSNKKAKAMNMGNQVEFRLCDYREVEEKFDRIVSVGMFEHVGINFFPNFFLTTHKLLNDRGIFLLHTIGRNTPSRSTDPWTNKYIFPNGMIPSPAQISKSAQGLFVIEDWHNFGQDYDPTLMAWNENFQKSYDNLKDRYDERFKRMWEYYLLMCAGTFRSRRNQLWQLILSKKGIKGGYSYQNSHRPNS